MLGYICNLCRVEYIESHGDVIGSRNVSRGLTIALEAFHIASFHDFGRWHVVYADYAQRRSFHNGKLLTIYIFIQLESVTFEAQGRSVCNIFPNKNIV